MLKTKSVLSFILILSLAFFISPITKANNIIAVSMNDNILDISDATMPEFLDSGIFMPYTLFSQNLNINSSYSSKYSTLVLYNSNATLTFNLDKWEVYDESGKSYYPSARMISGQVYVPLELVADVFGLHYSYISASVPLIRVNQSKPSLSDSSFLSLATPILQAKINAYNNKNDNVPITPPSGNNNSTTDTPSPEDVNPDITDLNTVYLTFDAPLSNSTEDILDFLEENGIYATFFIDETSILEEEELLRRIVGSGHSIGLLTNPQEEDILSLNELLTEKLNVSTLLIRFLETADASAFSEYVVVDYNVYANEDVYTTYATNVNIENELSKISGDAIIKFSNSSNTLSALQYTYNLCVSNGISLEKIYLSTKTLN